MIQKLTTTDPVIDEIHRTRREISDRFGGDTVAVPAAANGERSANQLAMIVANNSLPG